MGRKGNSGSSAKCQKYLNNHRRINNKTKKLAKFIEHLEKERTKLIEPIDGRLLRTRKPIENIVKSCRIGRKKEGFSKEDFKFRPRKKKEIINENKFNTEYRGEKNNTETKTSDNEIKIGG